MGKRIVLFRFNEEGTPDDGFGEGGSVNPIVEGSLTSEVRAVAVLPNDKILVAGKTLDTCQTEPLFERCWRLLVGRFNSDGSVDTGFGSEGFVRLETSNDVAWEPGPIGLAVVSGGKILLSEAPRREQGRFVLARYDADGELDRSFGNGGIVTALPCQGTVLQRRRLGCLSSAAARLRVAGLAGRRPHGRLRVTVDNAVDPIAAVRILLPSALRARPGAARRVRIVAVPRHEAAKNVQRGSIGVYRLGLARGLHVGLRPGLLRAVEKIESGHKLVFRVEVKLKDRTQRTFRIVKSG
jgi:uncharacterized delta-60 repeat protein